MVASDVGRAQAHIDDAHQLQGLFPEWPRLDQLVMNKGRIIHQQIQVPTLTFHLGEQRLDLGIVGVIANHGNAMATGGGNRRGGFL
ncbi:hypothetical protein D3C76_912600 [compost metagenome]